MGKKASIIAGILLALCSLLNVLLELSERSVWQGAIASGDVVHGVVLGVQPSTDRSSSYEVVFKYRKDGDLYQTANGISYSEYVSLKAGQPIKVILTATNPNRASIHPQQDLADANVHLAGWAFMFLVGLFVTYCGSAMRSDTQPAGGLTSSYFPNVTYGGSADNYVRWRISMTLGVLGLVSVLIILCSALQTISSYRLLHGGVTQQATITKLDRRYGPNEVNYEYFVGKTKYTGDTRVSDVEYNRLLQGGELDITYIPSEPYIAALDPSGDLRMDGAKILIGLGLGLITLFVLGVRRREPVF